MDDSGYAMKHRFLPLTKREMSERGWDEVDIVLVSGDAYVDHPSFGAAIIGRVLERAGYRVGIIAMPDWKNPDSVRTFGRPRLFFGVTSGNIDSMVARYTAFKRLRSDDPYAPGNRAGHKPDRAVIVYCNLIKSVYSDIPVVIGGIEASMRRVAHFDFWSNKVRRSILEDSKATILVHGMGEKAITMVAQRIAAGESLEGIPGTVVMSRTVPEQAKLLPAEEEVLQSNEPLIEFYRQFYRSQGKILAQPAGNRFLLHYPPAILTETELDEIYALPFTRLPHPLYREPVPAFDMIKNSVTSHRGCVSGCSFCTLTLHQGKRIQSRSATSILQEVERIAAGDDFKGHISDIGGPSANNYGFDCRIQWNCPRESCTFPDLCPNLILTADKWVQLLDRASEVPGVKLVTVGSGIRYDLFMKEPRGASLLNKLLKRHVSGQLKIAPEHTDAAVLRAMRKTPLSDLDAFITEFRSQNKSLGKKQHLLPYLMSCHPGSTHREMGTLQKKIYSLFGFMPEQVQTFIPLPMTISSIIFYTGVDPLTKEKFAVVRETGERRRQHGIFFRKQMPPDR
ncbi:MAG: YgiQ family radical SAM protein [Candidatus Zhuqueibacterota bacterium]